MSWDGTAAIYVTAVSIGMLHGVEPGHGWPVAAVFALAKPHRFWYGFWAAVILAVAHLTSSFAVVAVYALADHFFDLGDLRWIHLVAGGLLLVMAVRQWRSAGHSHHHGHGHDPHHRHPETPVSKRRAAGSLWGLVGFAFALGFVHEEEFAIIALAAGKTSPWLVMATYALAVAFSLNLLTLAAIATFNRFEKRLGRFQRHLPRISALVLGIMGLAYVLRLV